MRNGQLDNVLRYIRSLVAAGQTRELPDRELLERFVTRHDETAFAAIVERHGPLVLGICRRALQNEHYAEDACQATFLVLARKAGSIRKRQSLGCWLYGVAYRVARKLRADLKRRAARDVTLVDLPRPDTTGEITWREGLAVLDEELTRLPMTYRSALVLCYLEGRTQDEAARELGCSLGALRGRLERARECLRTRLVRRGVGLSATLLGTALGSTQSSAAVPPTLAITTVRAAAAFARGQTLLELISAHVTTLTEGVLKAMFLTKLKVVITLVFAVRLLSLGAGVLTGTADGERDVQGKAVSGQSTVAQDQKAAEHSTRTNAGKTLSQAGSAEKSNTEEHRIVALVRDTVGKPVSGAHVDWVAAVQPRLSHLAMPKGQNSGPRPFVVAAGNTDTGGRCELRARYASGEYPEMLLIATGPGYGLAGKSFTSDKDPVAITLRPEIRIKGQLFTPSGAPAKGVRIQLISVTFGPQETVGIDSRLTDAPPYWPSAVFTDDQGRFTLGGFSEDADPHLTLTHDEFAQEELNVTAKSTVRDLYKVFDIQPLKPEFKHTLQPARPVQGVVTAADTGKPLPGVVVEVIPWGPHGGQIFTTRTDAQGRYRVSGHAATSSPPLPQYTATVYPPPDSGYLSISDFQDEKRWPAGAKFVEKNFALPRGCLLHGTVLDGDSMKPVAGASIVYQPKQGNPHNRQEYDLRNRVLTDKDGSFTITGLRGEGFLVVEGPSPDYRRVTLPRDENTWGVDLFPHGFAKVNVGEKEEPAPVRIELWKGVTLEARVVLPDGSPGPWIYAGTRQLQACQIDRFDTSVRFDKGIFRMPGSDPSQTYRVFFVQPELHLGAVAELKYDGKPAEVRLEPTATVRGKLANSDGSPATSYQAYALLQLTKDLGKLTRRDSFSRDLFLIYSNLT